MSTPPPRTLGDTFNAIPFGPHANCTLDVTCTIEESVYRYRPSLAANGSFIAFYGLAFIVHLWLGFRWKAWWFTAFMLLGCVDEVVGYVGRIMLWYNPFSFPGFMIQIGTVMYLQDTIPFPVRLSWLVILRLRDKLTYLHQL